MLCELSDELHLMLEKQGLLTKNYKQRSRILKAIFKMLDLDEPKLLLRLARLILAVSEVSCILSFKLLIFLV